MELFDASQVGALDLGTEGGDGGGEPGGVDPLNCTTKTLDACARYESEQLADGAGPIRSCAPACITVSHGPFGTRLPAELRAITSCVTCVLPGERSLTNDDHPRQRKRACARCVSPPLPPEGERGAHVTMPSDERAPVAGESGRRLLPRSWRAMAWLISNASSRRLCELYSLAERLQGAHCSAPLPAKRAGSTERVLCDGR
eukprot:scaffold206257_cov35-Tisochrysis_lutea.AAC.2